MNKVTLFSILLIVGYQNSMNAMVADWPSKEKEESSASASPSESCASTKASSSSDEQPSPAAPKSPASSRRASMASVQQIPGKPVVFSGSELYEFLASRQHLDGQGLDQVHAKLETSPFKNLPGAERNIVGAELSGFIASLTSPYTRACFHARQAAAAMKEAGYTEVGHFEAAADASLIGLRKQLLKPLVPNNTIE